MILETGGFRVLPCANTSEALDLFEWYQPQAVIEMASSSGDAFVVGSPVIIATRSVRVLIHGERPAAGAKSTGRGAPPDLSMPHIEALTRLSRELREQLAKRSARGESEASWTEARETAHKIIRAVTRPGHEDVAHCVRLATWARRLGAVLALSPSRLFDLELGALLHDVGQLSVGDEALARAVPEAGRERARVEAHPQAGAELLRTVPALKRAIPVVLCHHERFDGSGFPRGLLRHAIPFEARVFQVVDTYEALVVGRPWRPAISHAAALDEMRALVGTQFDPAAFDAFATLPQADWRDGPTSVRAPLRSAA
jgi:hypothetical protein